MTDQELAESMVRNLGQQMGVDLNTQAVVQYATFLVGEFRGESWKQPKAEGLAAQAAVTSEAQAELAARERK